MAVSFIVGIAACLVLFSGCVRANPTKVSATDAGDAASNNADGPRSDAADARTDAVVNPACSADAGKGSKGKAESCSCNNECKSGFCVSGLCCDSACTDGCKTCSLASSLGTCTLVPAGGAPSNPNFCAASTPASCGLDGTCDGSGGCRKYVSGIICKNGTCDGDGVVGAKACDGKGSCSVSVDTPCAPYTCDPKTNECAENCSSNASCGAGHTCSGNSCGFKLNSSKCSNDSECASGHCADGYCCNVACTGACLTCKDPSALGRCKLVGAGLSDSRCPASSASTCGTTGLCDGSGACAVFPENTPCGAATCASSVTENTARVCDGQGTCRDAQVVDCAPFLCASGACNSSCLKDSDCQAGHQCVATTVNNTTTGRCGKVKPGASCTDASQCESGFCVDGVCCQSACDGACRSCNVPGSPGKCTNIAAGGADPRNGCKDLGQESCGTDGLCDGSGGCQIYSAGTSCGTDSCVQGAYTPGATCNQSGQCVTPPSITCNPYVCNGSKCFTACSNDSQCVTGNVCVNGSCGLKPAGAQCSAAKECKSNHCAQGVCCDSDCTDACKTCTLTASLGKCTAVADGTVDPQEKCKVTAQNTCGTTGACKAGVCAYWAKGANCAAAVCASSSVETPASTCDGAGKCATPTALDCGNYICSTTTNACLSACVSSADCVPPNTCSKGSCGLISNGNACTSGEQCLSGFCTEGVCCDSACSDATTGGLCKSCKVAGNVGKCSFVASGGADPKQRCAASDPLGKEDCSNDGTCNGNGACRPWSATTGCRKASCASPGSAFTPAATCNGAGKCCDGSGNCPPSTTPQSCSPYVCDSKLQVSCLTTCSTDADCVSGETCRKVDNKCGNKLALGQTCGAGTDCGSGNCIDSTCCGASTCNDNLACTADSCATSDGSCKHTLNSGYCLISGVCYAEGTTNPNNACQVCTTATSTTAWSSKANGTACDDGSVCTTSDTCSNGSCVGTGSLSCNDSNVCTTDSCDPKTGCVHTNNTLACDDGNACTKSDVCSAGKCAGTAYSCDDSLTCTTDTCNGDGTCTHTTAGTTCLIGGACHASGDANPSNACQQCTPTTSQTAWSNKSDGTTCSDGNACTQTDTCQSGTCTGSNPVVCTASDQCHNVGTCTPSTGLCTNPAKTDGTTCNDGNACTQTDTCQTGVCTGGNPVVCTASDQCHDVGVCNTGTGSCSNPAKADNTTCNDGNPCTSGDKCTSGSCAGTLYACDGKSGACNATCVGDGTCAFTAGTGCVISGACYAANAVNPSNACQQCSPATSTSAWSAVNCDDSNACTTDSCDSSNGCSHVAKTCTALDECHVAGTCDSSTGLCSNPVGNLGGTCTDSATDVCCQGGFCVASGTILDTVTCQ